jgi:hypothetical protein
MSTVKLANGHVAEIINGPYYHINLSNFEQFGGKDDSYPSRLKQTINSARLDLGVIIQQQEAQELQQLNLIFNKNITKTQLKTMGFKPQEIEVFLEHYNNGRKASSVDDKLKYLNLLINNSLHSDINDDDNMVRGLNYAIEQIGLAFGEGALSNKNITLNKMNIDEYQVFLNSLIAVYNSLLSSQKRLESKLPKEIILRPINKLRKAISFYQNEYNQLVRQEEEYTSKINDWVAGLSKNEIIKADWNRNKAQNRRNLSMMKSVLIDSATGFINQIKGKYFEAGVADLLAKSIGSIFDGQKILISTKGSTIGTRKNELNKFQKSDVQITIELSGSLPNKNIFSLKFSVKLTGDSSTIQIHHGGGLFAYASRFSIYNDTIGALLNDPNFQYNYVNALHESGSEGEFLTAFKTMLQAAGFYFLGEKIKNIGGADFLYVNNKIVSFSSILKRALENPEIFKVRVRATKFNALSMKKNEMRKEPYKSRKQSEYYQKDFIEMSMGIGRKAINGTTFTLDLRKSALNL